MFAYLFAGQFKHPLFYGGIVTTFYPVLTYNLKIPKLYKKSLFSLKFPQV